MDLRPRNESDRAAGPLAFPRLPRGDHRLRLVHVAAFLAWAALIRLSVVCPFTAFAGFFAVPAVVWVPALTRAALRVFTRHVFAWAFAWARAVACALWLADALAVALACALAVALAVALAWAEAVRLAVRLAVACAVLCALMEALERFFAGALDGGRVLLIFRTFLAVTCGDVFTLALVVVEVRLATWTAFLVVWLVDALALALAARRVVCWPHDIPHPL